MLHLFANSITKRFSRNNVRCRTFNLQRLEERIALSADGGLNGDTTASVAVQQFAPAGSPPSIQLANHGSGTGSISGVKFEDLNINGVRDFGFSAGDQAVVLFAIDVSGSMGSEFGGSISVGDLDGDGRSDTRLDATIAGYIALNQTLIAEGLGTNIQIGIITFTGSSTQLDVDPRDSSSLTFTTPTADLNGNSIPDIEEVLQSIRAGGGTDFEPPLRTAISSLEPLIANGAAGNLIFLSDGESSVTGLADEVQQLNDLGVNIQAFGVGSSASLSALQAIDPNAQRILTIDELLEAFSGLNSGGGIFLEPTLSGWTIYLDQNQNGMLDDGEHFEVTDASGSYQLTGLPPGTYYLREVMQSGWFQSAPGTGVIQVTLADGQEVEDQNFGNYRNDVIVPPITIDPPPVVDPPIDPPSPNPLPEIIDPTVPELLILTSQPRIEPPPTPEIFGSSGVVQQSADVVQAGFTSRATIRSPYRSGRGIDEIEVQIGLEHLLDFMVPDLLPIDIGDEPPQAGSEEGEESETEQPDSEQPDLSSEQQAETKTLSTDAITPNPSTSNFDAMQDAFAAIERTRQQTFKQFDDDETSPDSDEGSHLAAITIAAPTLGALALAKTQRSKRNF